MNSTSCAPYSILLFCTPISMSPAQAQHDKQMLVKALQPPATLAWVFNTRAARAAA